MQCKRERDKWDNGGEILQDLRISALPSLAWKKLDFCFRILPPHLPSNPFHLLTPHCSFSFSLFFSSIFHYLHYKSRPSPSPSDPPFIYTACRPSTTGEFIRHVLPEKEKAGVSNRSSSGSDEGELHVLAVDDSHVDRKVIERLLKISSCKVTAMESGTRALQFLGLDGEESSDGFDDARRMSSDICRYPCLVAKKRRSLC